MKDWLVLDKRSLGLLRILLGLGLAFDVVLRGLHLRAHYTSHGVFPLNQYLIQQDLLQRRWGVFYINDTSLVVGLLLLLLLLSALSLAFGYRTRLSGWLCWFLLIGLFRRNPMVNNAGDLYLPLLLMWGNFLPWNQAFAVDNTQADEVGDKPDWSYSSFPGFCYLTQVCILYWFSVVLKTGPAWQVDHSALYYVLHLDSMASPLAPILLFSGTETLRLITKVTLYWEVLGPLLLFVPSRYFRLMGVLSITMFHLGILATLTIQIFAYVCAVGPLGLLPSMVWENRFGQRLAKGLDSIASSIRKRLPATDRKLTPDTTRAQKLYLYIPYLLMGLTLYHLVSGPAPMNDKKPAIVAIYALSLDQRWGMFCPGPPRSDAWESAKARLASGRVVNLITGEDYDPDKLANSQSLLDYRWRCFNSRLDSASDEHASLTLQYLVESWDSEHPDDPVLAARYAEHPIKTNKAFLLGDEGTSVRAVYLK